MSKRYDLAVVMGRFQFFHYGHLSLIHKALEIADHVLVVIGSSGVARSMKNPFTFEERREMILSLEKFGHINTNESLMFVGIRDHHNDNVWVEKVQRAVENTYTGPRVAIVGYDKDDTTYYLKMFPNYDLIKVPPVVLDNTLDATALRRILFQSKVLPSNQYAPDSVLAWVAEWKINNPEVFDNLCDEFDYIENYKASWKPAPFQPTFVTTDAVVVCSGHVLLIKRRVAPGKGLWALPGGFLNQNEFIVDGMLRELEEETRIKVSKKDLLKNIKASRVFDHPNRSLRGRTISHTYLIHLENGPLPRVRGSDDAERAKWFPINTVFNDMGDKMFEDHWNNTYTMITA